MEYNTDQQNNDSVPMTEKHKNLIILSVAILLVLALALGINYLKKDMAGELVVEGCRPGDLFSQTTGEQCSEGEIEACQPGEQYDRNNGEPCQNVEIESSPTATTTNTLGYEEAISAYAGANILFGENCTATPATLGMKTGSRILLANNSSSSQDLVVEGKAVTLRPYRYMTSKLTTEGESTIQCGGTPKATITVE